MIKLFIRFRKQQIEELIISSHSLSACRSDWKEYKLIIRGGSPIKMVNLKRLHLIHIESTRKWDEDEKRYAFIPGNYDPQQDIFNNEDLSDSWGNRGAYYITSMTHHDIILKKFLYGRPVYSEKNLEPNPFECLVDLKNISTDSFL